MLNCRIQNIALVFLFLAWVHFLKAQEVPPIAYFSPQSYNAESQNWAISQTENKFIYAANNKGLLEYNGSLWQLYPSPNKTILRSVKAIDNRIYTGCYMEFGFWAKDNHDQLHYTSLSSKMQMPIIEDEQFWQIESISDRVLFRSLERILIYNPKTDNFNSVESNSQILKVFKVEEDIYFQNVDEGILKFEDGIAKSFLKNSTIKNSVIINIFQNGDGLTMVTQDDGIFRLTNNVLTKLVLDEAVELENTTVYSAITTQNGTLILGTIGNGILEIDNTGSLIRSIDQTSGLDDNTVLSMFQDARGNVWLGLDNGINVINMQSRFTVFNDDDGRLGTIYTSLLYNNIVYLGTNQGLFYRKINDDGKFKFINGTQGQVWFLKAVNNTVFCGHNLGTFVVNGAEAELVSDIAGAWDVVRINDQLLLQGNFFGLYILELDDDKWRIRNKLENFNMSSRDFEFYDNNIFVNHEYKGLYRLEVDESYKSILKVEALKGVEKSTHSGLTKYQGNLLYSNDKAIYSYNLDSDKFIEDISVSRLYKTEEYSSGRLLVDNQKRLWAFTQKDIRYLQYNSITAEPSITHIPLPQSMREEMAGFENILRLENNRYLIGTSKGYMIFDTNNQEPTDYNIYLNTVKVSTKDNANKFIFKEGKSVLDHDQNNLRFEYSIPQYSKYFGSNFKYRLKGYQDNWSSWSKNSSVEFKNLSPGSYEFMLMGNVGGLDIENDDAFLFTIKRPWYLSNFMLVLYFAIVVLFSILMHLLYTNRYNRQKAKILLEKEKEIKLVNLEKEQQEMQFINEKLRQDVEGKNRELAISTMSLIKKNEFLYELKKELLKSKDQNNSKELLQIVDKNINKDSDWKFFEEAFNNADKDFLKKVKDKHPALTHNDLRLCAYLRLNLSSKEIAPLLNITYRSVEIKRYRLRKKMNLEHNVSLTGYILSI